jgi:hypothetical protein
MGHGLGYPRREITHGARAGFNAGRAARAAGTAPQSVIDLRSMKRMYFPCQRLPVNVYTRRSESVEEGGRTASESRYAGSSLATHRRGAQREGVASGAATRMRRAHTVTHRARAVMRRACAVHTPCTRRDAP